MKKLFSSQQAGHVGKVFSVGRCLVTVEDVIAEGKKEYKTHVLLLSLTHTYTFNIITVPFQLAGHHQNYNQTFPI